MLLSNRTVGLILLYIYRKLSLLTQKTSQRASLDTLYLYLVLRGEKQLTLRGQKRYNVQSSIQRVIILFSIQYQLNLGVIQLLQLSRIRSQQTIYIYTIYLLKYFTYFNTNVFHKRAPIPSERPTQKLTKIYK